MTRKIHNVKQGNYCKSNNQKGDGAMILAMPNVKELLTELRENDWYITAYPFAFGNKEYVVVFEDLRELDKGTQFYGACMTFIDVQNEKRRLETYVNSYNFKKDSKELIEFFGIEAKGYTGNSIIWQLYNALNEATPTKFSPIEEKYKKYAVEVIDAHEGKEGLCCYKAVRNGKKANGEQIRRSAKNTAKIRLLRPELYALIGEKDDTISFYFRQENEIDTPMILLAFNNSYNKKS